jgi:hypothetical protein
MLSYLETPEPGSLRVPSALKASSLSCGFSRSMRVGLRGRGACKSVCPWCAFASIEEDSAITKRRMSASRSDCAEEADLSMWSV